jgi:lysophospholipase L1-like esterase
MNRNTTQKPLRYLALGDSYTIGESVAAMDRWPMQLTRRLNEERFLISPPHIVARTGWTTDELFTATEDPLLEPPFDLISLLIGVNDQYRRREFRLFCGDWSRIFQRALAWVEKDKTRLWVVSIPDWGVTPFAAREHRAQESIAWEIDAYNNWIRAECEAASVLFIDITQLTRELSSKIAMLIDDGLHPSALQYAAWTEKMFPLIQSKVNALCAV